MENNDGSDEERFVKEFLFPLTEYDEKRAETVQKQTKNAIRLIKHFRNREVSFVLSKVVNHCIAHHDWRTTKSTLRLIHDFLLQLASLPDAMPFARNLASACSVLRRWPSPMPRRI